MRARLPDRSGTVDREGVRIGYDVYGSGEIAILLLPAWAIADSRLWKANVAYLAQHFTVITYDPRGNGRSDRPADPAEQAAGRLVGDAVAVLDACGVERAVVVGNSFGATLAYLLAAGHPDRVLGMVMIGATINLDGRTDDPLSRAMLSFLDEPTGDRGWALYNRQNWDRDFAAFVRFFVGEAVSEPHSTKHIEDAVGWGLATDPPALAATVLARGQASVAETAARLRSMAPAIRCPALIIHGDTDRVAPPHRGETLARLLEAPLVVIEGAGHCPQGRHPVRVNRLLRDFAAQFARSGKVTVRQAGGTAAVGNGHRGGPRVLYLSSPIGLGHARRDTAIADALRELVPDARIDWLAQDPVTRVLADRGEHIHPASRALANESAHLEGEATGHDLHVFEAMRRMDEIMIANFMTFLEVVETDRYDLVIGDEAWDVDHFLHEDPTVKHSRFAWLTDFVGYLPMPAGGPREAALTADYNAEMLQHIERHPGVRDRSIFVGDLDDVVDLPFGPGLPSIREWTAAHYGFAGYITGFDPAALPDRAELRAELGYAAEETVVVAAVGGSGVGVPLLRRLIEAHRLAAHTIDGLRTVLVTGPRIDPAALPDVPGVDKRAFVPDLHRHLTACDLAAVQGGLTTTMELTAAGRPFLYFPLTNHFEQQIHVRHRLDRYRAGRAMDYAAATPEVIADAMVAELGRSRSYLPVPTGGARRAAGLLADLL
ncbi:MAG TPA: alpha/beta fold hydrolase [Jiangellaceae bacterium]|nr:alpha/beta fold hydrolase [Jiangellaceae bacterium]